MYQLPKNIAAEIAPQICYALRDIGVIFVNKFYIVVPNWCIITLEVLYTHSLG